MKAKLDTGADRSSIDASEIEYVEIDDTRFVRFSVETKSAHGNKLTLELPLAGETRIRQHSTESVSRPVVEMTVCLAQLCKRTRVSLADRSQFSTPLLLGREFLAPQIIVDSSRQFTSPATARCPAINSPE